MTHRFVVGPDLALSEDQSRQISQVLRLGPGDVVTLVHEGEELAYRIDRVGPGVAGTIVGRRPGAREPRLALTLALPLLRGEHTEQVVESATQLGVARFVPFTCERSVVRELSAAKRARLERIAREATETSRRARVPALAPVAAWRDLFGVLGAPVYVAWEEEHERALKDAVDRSAPAAALVVGPEGGLTADEIAHARSCGAVTVSLGERNLRSETAAVAATALLLIG